MVEGQRRGRTVPLPFRPSGKSASVLSWQRVFLDVLWFVFCYSSDHGD